MLIDGELTEAISLQRTAIRNPANGEVVGTVPTGEREDASRALQAAWRAFPSWAATSGRDRAVILHKGAALVRERLGDIARLLTLEEGKPLKDSIREVAAAAEVLDYYAEEGKRVRGEYVSPFLPNSRSIVVRQPLGVAALITPWNLPVDLLAWKLGPALAAGCTVVAKPPSQAPMAATALALAVHDAGAPPGTVNVVHGKGDVVGDELVCNPISRKVAFTGETATGRSIMKRASDRIKRLSLELGGHTPAIVCEDAMLKEAVKSCVARSFSNMGQICISINRLYVAEPIIDEFIDLFVKKTAELKVGDGMDPNSDLGPMFSESGRQRTADHISDAIKKGACVLCGGREPEGEIYSKGFFFLPTVLSGVNHSMRIMSEETFGPVAPIMSFKDLDEAISLANDSEYGLAAYVFTEDMRTAFHASERLHAGGVGINVNNVADLHAPFGGWKQSGAGRELSHHGLEAYLELKHIRIGL
jgi:succinate-semialdehyde dehydrogenase